MTKFHHKQSTTLTWPAFPQENGIMKIKSFHGVIQSNNTASATWNFGRVFFYSIFVNTRNYTPDWFLRGVCKKFYRSLILNMIQRIFSSSYILNHAQESFYGNFLHLKMFEVNLKLCCFNSFLGPGTNQNWSRDSINVWIAMLWKDIELEFEENLSQNIV